VRGTVLRTPERVAEAQRLRSEGVILKEIAARIGVALSTVHMWLTDPDGEQLRARKESYRGVCVECGAPTSGGKGRGEKAPQRCGECSSRINAHLLGLRRIAEAEPRRREIAEMYRAGVPLKDIAAHFGIAVGNLGDKLNTMRAQGWDLPRRYSTDRVEAMRSARHGAPASAPQEPSQ
jgi:transposase